MEKRTLAFIDTKVGVETRADGSNAIVGYGSVFYNGSPDSEYELWQGAKERIMPGAFDKALGTDDVRALFNHDPNFVLGRTANGTMKLTSDSKGLRYEITPPDTQAAKDLMASIKRGDISGSSFSFVVTDEQWRKENNVRVREVRGVRLFDVGPVTYPAYAGTSTGVRAAGNTDEAMRSLNAFEAEQAAIEAENDARARKICIDEKE